MKIKRVNYVLTLRDFWQVKRLDRLKHKKGQKLNIKEEVIEHNRQALCKMVHQMQLFQQELLHFSNNLEYYIKTRAIQSICNEMNARLKELSHL